MQGRGFALGSAMWFGLLGLSTVGYLYSHQLTPNWPVYALLAMPLLLELVAALRDEAWPWLPIGAGLAGALTLLAVGVAPGLGLILLPGTVLAVVAYVRNRRPEPVPPPRPPARGRRR